MDTSWFWQGLFTNGIWWLLLLGGGAVVAILKVRRPSWAPPVLYGLGALACLSVIFFTFTGRSVFSPAPVTPSNIEANVQKWIANFGYGSQSVAPPSSDDDFAYQVTPPTGARMIILRDKKNRPGYLQIQTTLAISPEHTAILQRITPAQALQVIEETEAEILRRRMAFMMVGTDANHVQAISIIRAVPVDALTQTGFGDAFDDVETAASLTRNLFVLSLQKYADVVTPIPIPKTQ